MHVDKEVKNIIAKVTIFPNEESGLMIRPRNCYVKIPTKEAESFARIVSSSFRGHGFMGTFLNVDIQFMVFPKIDSRRVLSKDEFWTALDAFVDETAKKVFGFLPDVEEDTGKESEAESVEVSISEETMNRIDAVASMLCTSRAKAVDMMSENFLKEILDDSECEPKKEDSAKNGSLQTKTLESVFDQEILDSITRVANLSGCSPKEIIQTAVDVGLLSMLSDMRSTD